MRKLLFLLVTLDGAVVGLLVRRLVGDPQHGGRTWFAAQAARGVTAETSSLSVAGFPNRFDLTVEGIRWPIPPAASAGRPPSPRSSR